MKRMLLLLVTGSLLGCVQPSSSQFERVTGTPFVEALKQAERVSLSTLLPERSEPKLLSVEETAAVKALLLDDRHYYFDKTKTTPFYPEVALEVGKGYTVLVSFSAKQIKILGPEIKVKLDNDPASTALEDLLK